MNDPIASAPSTAPSPPPLTTVDDNDKPLSPNSPLISQPATPVDGRERGTPINTLPRGLSRSACTLTVVISAALASALVVRSLRTADGNREDGEEYSPNVRQWAAIFVVSSLGAASAAIGLVFGDSIAHSFAFGSLAFLARAFWSIAAEPMNLVEEALLQASPPLIAAVLLASPTTSRWFSRGASLVPPLHRVGTAACCASPLLALVYAVVAAIPGSVSSALCAPIRWVGFAGMSALPLGMTAWAALALYYLYYRNRSHGNACLLTPDMTMHAVVVAAAIVASAFLFIKADWDSDRKGGTSGTVCTVAFLAGSLVLLLLAAVFCSIADAWYPVGAAQFHMLSIDTTALLLYMTCPTVLLLLRFVDRYGGFVDETATVAKEAMRLGLGSVGALPTNSTNLHDYDYRFLLVSSFVLTLTVVTAVGVPLINALCPLGGYLFATFRGGLCYTHGQPNTKEIAICVNFCDIFPEGGDVKVGDDADGTEKDREALWKFLKEKKGENQRSTAVLNVFATLEDIKAYPDALRKLVEKGHSVGVAPSPFNNATTASSIFPYLPMQWHRAQCAVETLAKEYAVVFGTRPSWYLSKSTVGFGRHPASLQAASELGLKVAFWSSSRTAGATPEEQVALVKSDVLKKNGGNIIYIAREWDQQDAKSDGIWNVLHRIVEAISMIEADGDEKGRKVKWKSYHFSALSSVAKEEIAMVL